MQTYSFFQAKNFIEEIHTDYIEYYRTDAGREITDSQQPKEGPAAIITNSQNDETGKSGSARTAALPSARVYSANTAPGVLKDVTEEIEQEQKTIAKEKEELKHLQDLRDTLKAARLLLKLNSLTHGNTLKIKTIEIEKIESDIKDKKYDLENSEQYFNFLIENYQNMLNKGPRCIKALQALGVLGNPRTAEEPISLIPQYKSGKDALIIIIDDQPENIAQILDALSSKITKADKEIENLREE
mgnify:CR=1 FL=1